MLQKLVLPGYPQVGLPCEPGDIPARLPLNSGHNHLSKASRGGEAWINKILKGDKTGWLLLKHSYGKCDDLIKIGICKDVSTYHP